MLLISSEFIHIFTNLKFSININYFEIIKISILNTHNYNKDLVILHKTVIVFFLSSSWFIFLFIQNISMHININLHDEFCFKYNTGILLIKNNFSDFSC